MAVEPGTGAALPRLGVLGWVRWTWRQLTSMRSALLLLFLLAVASVPGSVVPQRLINPGKVSEYYRTHPALAPWLDRLGLFDVFAAPWFAAIYLLLFASLAGCVVPRLVAHLSAARAQPPAPPRHLDRLPYAAQWDSGEAPDAVVDTAAAVLRRRRFRVVRHDGAVAAEKGFSRETGNLLFHVSLLVLLAAVAMGALFGYRANAVIVVGQGWSNSVLQFDSFQPGRLFDIRSLPPFSFRLQDFRATYQETGPQRGAPRSFLAQLQVTRQPGDAAEPFTLRVNHPLEVGGTKVFLTGHGYAPRFTVRDGTGQVVLSSAVPFLPQDGMFTSTGVVKVPDARPQQLGFSGFFLPTAVVGPTGPRSAFPAARDPAVFLTAFVGDLGLDSGRPQSVYQLDRSRMTQVMDPQRTAQPWAVALRPGQSATLPGGLGSITFDGLSEFAAVSIADNPGKGWALAASMLALAGLLLSLFVRRRRVWVRASAGPDGRTVVAVGGLTRTEAGGFGAEFAALVAQLRDGREEHSWASRN